MSTQSKSLVSPVEKDERKMLAKEMSIDLIMTLRKNNTNHTLIVLYEFFLTNKVNMF
jgi:hypothetical protein